MFARCMVNIQCGCIYMSSLDRLHSLNYRLYKDFLRRGELIHISLQDTVMPAAQTFFSTLLSPRIPLTDPIRLNR